MSVRTIPADPAKIGATSAFYVVPAMYDGRQMTNRQTGVPEWDVEISCLLGRFSVRVGSAQPPAGLPVVQQGTEVLPEDPIPVVLERLAVTGWGRTGPYMAATAVRATQQPATRAGSAA